MLTLMVQFGGERFHPGHINLLDPVVVLVFGVCLGAVVVPLLERLVGRARGAHRAWRAKRRRQRAALDAERRGRALMSELCPHGWHAQITLFGMPGAQSGDAPTNDRLRQRVALDWTELRDETGRPAVMRRVWAATIADALDAMVADRRTDETLEQIEQGAVAAGALWTDLY